jgi:hypothetical protein
MSLEEAGSLIIERFPKRWNQDRAKVARDFFEQHPDYWGYLSKTMEAFRQALAQMPSDERPSRWDN